MSQSQKARSGWFKPFGELSPGRDFLLTACSFLLPLGVWCALSYIPTLWHPLVRITDPGDVSYFRVDHLVERERFAEENLGTIEQGGQPAQGIRSNPVFLPAPHEVIEAFYSAFTTPPRRRGEPWLHESLWHSIQIIFWGFIYSSLIGVPLGILCGVFPLFSRLGEPVVEFIRYMPAPVFGALAVAVMGIHDAPKIAIIFIGTFFQQVLVVANTTRKLDPSLVEAALTLGTNRIQLLFTVVLPGIMVDLYRDMRILLGWAWTYLIVAELIGASSGITYFINQQAKYRIYDNVFAAIFMIGLIGFISDRMLAWLGRQLFPWQASSKPGLLRKWNAWRFKKGREGSVDNTAQA
ncbi:MAG: ABC transporter permease subunit [Verrucomicrobiales bacterium]